MSNTLFDHIVASVITNTGRADLLPLTQLAVQKATMQLHISDQYSPDLAAYNLASQVPDADSTIYTSKYTIPFESNPAFLNVRDIWHIDSGAPDNQGAIVPYTRMSPSNLMDGYNITKVNVWYTMGNNLILILPQELTGVRILYFKNPILDPVGYTSWIANKYSYMITTLATARVMQALGRRSEYMMYMQEHSENVHFLQANHISDQF